MGRTINHFDEKPKSGRKMPEIITTRKMPTVFVMENRCYWPCPCGGTVADAPSHCLFRKKRGKGFWCTDVLACLLCCGDKAECRAYNEYMEETKQRRVADNIHSLEIQKRKEKGEQC